MDLIANDLFGIEKNYPRIMNDVIIGREIKAIGLLSDIDSKFHFQLVIKKKEYFLIWDTLERLLLEGREQRRYIYEIELKRYLYSDIVRIVIDFI